MKRDKKSKSSQQYRVKRIFKNHQGQKGSNLYNIIVGRRQEAGGGDN